MREKGIIYSPEYKNDELNHLLYLRPQKYTLFFIFFLSCSPINWQICVITAKQYNEKKIAKNKH